jgi:hypothetical protein
VRQAEKPGGARRDLGGGIVGRDHGAQRPVPGEVGDGARRRLRVGERQRDRPAGGDPLEGLALLGADDGLDAETVGRLEEIGGLVSAGREEQQDARPVRGPGGRQARDSMATYSRRALPV